MNNAEKIKVLKEALKNEKDPVMICKIVNKIHWLGGEVDLSTKIV